MIRLSYDPELVEEAVMLAESAMPPEEAGAFRRERDRLYGIVEPQQREAAFRSLHLGWFTRIGLHESIGTVVAAREDLAQRLDEGRVLRAVARNEEGADLVDHVAASAVEDRPILVLRLRPATVLDPDRVRALLHHELTHVADMLDPAFGYERSLPSSDDGPSGDNIQRDRYRVLWDVTIDGRLARSLRADQPGASRDARWREFAATFSMLGDACRSAFNAWFDCAHPTHAELVAFALAPAGSETTRNSGRCPLCRFPVASLDPRPDRLSPATVTAIGEHHPSWDVAQGLCSQCLDLYEARYGETSHAGCG
ncbi:MAG: hypothetical protein A3F69_05370 [Acidobacteria bacterium RIFCSPLOWO2_12_FULL_66_10]|nr:MAG: hypothetical protein A3F69_05370 [Acidobacteria bacterium RIFCSPLOWO2_12_FULL_66_10]